MGIHRAIGACWLLILLAAVPPSNAQESGAAGPPTVEELQRKLEEQRKQLDEQAARLEEQRKLIEDQGKALNDQRRVLLSLQTQIDQIAQQAPAAASEEQVALHERLQKLEDVVGERPEAPSIDEEFPGAIPIPGTNAAIRFGGYVKMAAVGTADALGSDDRFIVASIPVEEQSSGDDARMSFSAQQSRINIDVRQEAPAGQLRAFLESDFAGDGGGGNRLRHAFGQFRTVLAGQTWSTLVDTQALPEEIDFEGLSARVNLRQAQIRWMPKLGEKLSWTLALEDPSPDVTNGDGVSLWPDLVSSIRRTIGKRHVQVALLLRQIRAQPDADPDDTESEFGWGISWSGKVKASGRNDRDHFLFQLNFGDGIGRYINDLEEEGGQDAIIDPDTGRMKALFAAGGYFAYNRWWSERFRSTFVYSKVYVDNLDEQRGAAYRTTDRVTANLLFSPIPKFDLGVELLWGRRENKDRKSGTAGQIQFAWVYRY